MLVYRSKDGTQKCVLDIGGLAPRRCNKSHISVCRGRYDEVHKTRCTT